MTYYKNVIKANPERLAAHKKRNKAAYEEIKKDPKKYAERKKKQ